MLILLTHVLVLRSIGRGSELVSLEADEAGELSNEEEESDQMDDNGEEVGSEIDRVSE